MRHALRGFVASLLGALFLLAGCAGIHGSPIAPQEDPTTPKSEDEITRGAEQAGATPLLELDAIALRHHSAAMQITDQLRNQGENPADFFLAVQEVDQEVVFTLYFKDIFLEKYASYRGDPTGRCRTIHYDPSKRQFTRVTYWR